MSTKTRGPKYHPPAGPKEPVRPWTAEDEASRRSQRCSVCGGEPDWDSGEYLFESKCWDCRNGITPGTDLKDADTEYAEAEEFLTTYEGTFQFLVEVKAKVASGWVLTEKQIAAVLRCKARTPGPTREPEQKTEPAIRDGYFTVILEDGSHVTIRIKAHWDKARAEGGEQVAAYLMGSDNENDYQGFAFIKGGRFNLWKKFQHSNTGRDRRIEKALVTLIQGDPGEAGLRYAIESSRCSVCGRRLTVPASVHRGLGPECAGGL